MKDVFVNSIFLSSFAPSPLALVTPARPASILSEFCDFETNPTGLFTGF